MMRKLIVFILGGLALGLAACSSALPTKAGPQEITVEVSEFKFQPATIEVAAGSPVKITMRNQSAVEHDWNIMKIPAAGIKSLSQSAMEHDMGGANQPELHMSAMMGQIAQMEFTPTRPGTYEFYCAVVGHKESGMVGTLVVK